MKFDIFNHVSSRGVECPDSSTLLNTMDSDKVRRTIASIREAVKKGNDKQVGELKKMLPAVTWQAHFADGVRNNDHAEPSGLYMLDIDHVDDPRGMFKQWQPALLVECGVVFIHISPSGAGLRVVARCLYEGRTIAQHQAWLAEKLGVVAYDAACKDFARLAFLASYDDILFHDYEKMFMEAAMLPAAAEQYAPSTLKTPAKAEQQNLFTDEQRTKEYRGHLVGEIAQQWTEHVGMPVEGERHNFYYELAKTFRHIVDNDYGVLLAQLPDFGLSLDERQKICEHTAKTNRGNKIPYKFWAWMQQQGIVPKTQKDSRAEAKAEEFERAIAEQMERQKEEALRDDPEPKPAAVPTLPKVFKEFCSVCPPDFVLPTVNALLPLLGTLATRVRATYLDGVEHTTTFHTVIYADASSGKSFARRLYQRLTVDLQKHDAFSIAREQQYLEELRQKKNATQQPKDPHCPYRIQMAITSVPMILRRQQDAMGLHTITFDEEIDTMAKANKGGSYAQKSDLYRKAWDNAEYGQEYISGNTFTGRVNLFMNFLLLGTPVQMMKFYNDPENGLISRVNFCEIPNQDYALLPKWKKMSPKQEEVIDKVLRRFEQMTYEPVEDTDNEWTVKPTVNVDDKLKFFMPLLSNWLEQKRLDALDDQDRTKDMFRRRSAVKAFRAAMLCVAMYDTLNAATQKVISDFCLWLADNDLRTLCELYTVEKKRKDAKRTIGRPSILDTLPDEFTREDVYVAGIKGGKTATVSQTIATWVCYGRIEKVGDNLYRKVKKGGKA